MIDSLITRIMNFIVGDRIVDQAKDWQQAHDKASASRAEVEQIIRESEKEKTKEES